MTDIGSYGAAISGLLGAAESDKTKSHMIILDIGKPFTTMLKKGRFATHTWDIVSLLGAYDDMMPESCHPGVFEWRCLVLDYCHTRELPCEAWRPTAQSGLLIQMDGIKHLDHKTLGNSRAQILLYSVEQEGGEKGFDLPWENVVRFFLKTGNLRGIRTKLKISWKGTTKGRRDCRMKSSRKNPDYLAVHSVARNRTIEYMN